ncbi:MAG: esterase [Balneolaceae bacterium]|nr:esterase [Balneolaceae bacterium]
MNKEGTDKRKVHLVLGSGGARGIAHIGVIEELEQQGYEIIEVIGCSMGAVVGGIYAAGHLPEYKEWLMSLSKKDVFDLLDFTFTKQGFVKGEKLFSKHLEVTGLQNIEEFNIPFTAVATDMKHNEEVHFTSGELYKALRASVSIPGVFVPVVDGNRILVDGGVLNPLPVNLVKKQEDAMVVAVDVNGKIIPDVDEVSASTSDPEDKQEEEDRLKKWFDDLIPDALHEYREKLENEKNNRPSFSLFELMDSTFSFTQDRLTDLMIQMYKPDHLITIPRNTCDTFDFHEAEMVIDQGRKFYHSSMDSKEEA